MRRIEVGSHVTTSRPNHLVCPACGYGALCPQGPLSRSPDCEYCCCTFDGALVETLKQIVALPDAMGKHACECGHPEMRSLPDGTFHCPACRSEVVPTEPNPAPSLTLRKQANKEDLLGSAEKGGQSRIG